MTCTNCEKELKGYGTTGYCGPCAMSMVLKPGARKRAGKANKLTAKRSTLLARMAKRDARRINKILG